MLKRSIFILFFAFLFKDIYVICANNHLDAVDQVLPESIQKFIEPIYDEERKALEIQIGRLSVKSTDSSITASQIVSGQISKVYEHVRLKSLFGNRPKLYEAYLNALKKEFGEQSNSEKHLLNKNRLEKLKSLFACQIHTMKNLKEYEEWRKQKGQKFKQIESEGDHIEAYFLNLFSNHPDLDPESVADRAMIILLRILNDKYAKYYPALKEYKKERLRPCAEGSRFIYHAYDEGIFFTEIMKGTTADRVGIKEGDQLISVNGKMIKDEDTMVEAFKTIQKIDYIPEFKVMRGNETLRIHFPKEKIQVPFATSRSFGSIGVIKINAFRNKVAEEVRSAFEKLMSQKIAALILDLRDNTGGGTENISPILSLFMKNRYIGSFHYGDEKIVGNYTSSIYEENIKLPIVLLVNEYTASCAEVVVGALKDNLSAKIIGATTFGKGQGQETFHGPLFSQIKFSTFETVSPQGYRHNFIGFTPDYQTMYPSAQTIAALRAAGQREFNIELRNYAMTINHSEPISTYFKVKKHRDKTYIPVEILTAPFLLKWEKGIHSCTIHVQNGLGKNHVFATIPEKKDEFDDLFISIEDFAQDFPALTYIKGQQKLFMNFS